MSGSYSRVSSVLLYFKVLSSSFWSDGVFLYFGAMFMHLLGRYTSRKEGYKNSENDKVSGQLTADVVITLNHS